MAYYYILALDEREYGPLDLPALKQWLLDYRVTPGTMLIDANTRITTTLGDAADLDQQRGPCEHGHDGGFEVRPGGPKRRIYLRAY